MAFRQEKPPSIPAEVPKEADVVIIGGGSLGCNTLYNLVKLGVTNTVLLEAHQLTAGLTRDTIIRIEEESGVNPGWINNGGMFIASNKERLDEYKRLQTIGKTQKIESFILGPKESKELYPLLNVSDVFGTLYCPGDGTIEPAGFCTALTRYATKFGAKVIENCPVLNINTEESLLGGKQVKEVVTPHGTIKTHNVVNATGAWANSITNLVGVTIPLVPMKHAYVVTEKIPGIENTPNLRDHDASVYMKLQGDALAIGGYEVNPIILEKVEKDFSFSLFDLDWNVFSAHIEGAVNRIPSLEKIGIKSTVCGPESFTPDHKPIMGEDPNVSGFYHCCGFNSSGMMLGGGCGNQMAHWIVKGRPELDMFGYDIRRFNPSLNNNKSWAIERSHEAYAKNYSTILSENGCVFQERHGWERPGWFNVHPTPIKPYDWYGAYNTPLAKDHLYKETLKADYTFDFPPHHHLVSSI
ncbi:Sarcosine dehydrogenase, mitochondrial, partial [Armadillidium nasatum]